MAEFLRTSGISHQIEEIIINAKEKLVIVSPYLKLTENLFERLKEKDLEEIELIFIYGKSELNENEKRKLDSLQNLSLYYHKNLHAKCYFNESKMLITSMNLYEFSEKNNREMGVLVDKQKDSSIFENAEQESFSILKASNLIKKAATNSKNKKQHSIEEFEFYTEGDISKWLDKTVHLLSLKYDFLEFKKSELSPRIDCESFLTDNLSIEIIPKIKSLRIIFKINGGKNSKFLYNKVEVLGRNSLENSFTARVIGWGNQMNRIKLDFFSEEYPEILKYGKNSIMQTIETIVIGGNIISEILNKRE
ncbi:MAG: phospholipase D family protein [Crocinitomicaceae bacterium]|nr:phospholipase D family protein [Crocinitomicaceae bacterium]